MNRRSFLTGAALGAASVPFTALVARATDYEDPHGWRSRE
jgi:hypothetical protein